MAKKQKKAKEKPVKPVVLKEEKQGGGLLAVLYVLLVFVGIVELAILAFIGLRIVSVFTGDYSNTAAQGAAAYTQSQTSSPNTAAPSVLAAAATSAPTPTPTPTPGSASGAVFLSEAAVKPEVSAEDPAAQAGGGVQGAYVGSTESDKYHWPDCRWAEEILPEHEIWFGDETEAASAGYIACEVCW